MTPRIRITTALLLALVLLGAPTWQALAKEIPAQLPDPDTKAPDATKQVKVYILSGQSNMVGMGDITGGGVRWGKQFLDPVVSVYEGAYSPDADYDKMTPIKTMKLPAFGGVRPTPYPGGGTHVTRGHVRMKDTGVYRFKPGYGDSMHCIMEVGGKEVHRKEVGKDPVRTDIKCEAGTKYPLKITYLTSRPNGLGWVLRTDIPGTLDTLARQQGKFPHLVDDQGQWTVRNDVVYKGVVSAVGQGPLTVGLQGNTIGPELQFGHIMGYYHDEPVLLIKVSIGNRSLGWDILPPGSKRYEFEEKDRRSGEMKTYVYAGYKDSPSRWVKGTEPKKINWYAGKQYDDYVKATKDVLDNFDTLFPAWKGRGYEVAGFVWWQGHKDGGSKAHIAKYEENMVALIQAWRKEFKAPGAPWAIATVGFDGKDMPENYVEILKAQMAVADPKKHPELAGTVKTVDIRDLWRGVDVSPRSQGYHYNRNAETYIMVGDRLGRAMAELQNAKK